MFRAVVAQVSRRIAAELAEKYARRLEQARLFYVLMFRPARRTIGGYAPGLTRAMNRHGHGGAGAQHTAHRGDHAAAHEYVRCVRLVGIPPDEELPGVVDRQTADMAGGRAQARRVAKRCGRVLRTSPDAHAGHRANHHDMPEQYPRMRHRNFVHHTSLHRLCAAYARKCVPCEHMISLIHGCWNTNLLERAPAWSMGKTTM